MDLKSPRHLIKRPLLMVEGEGFEPSYSERTDLQSVAFNHSATPPNRTLNYVGFFDFCQTNEGLIDKE